MMCTRPNICYAVSLVSKYQSNPGKDHWKAIKRILTPEANCSSYTMLCESYLFIRGYTNTDWAGDRADRNSTSGYIFLLNGGDIS